MTVLHSVSLKIGSNTRDWHQEYRIKVTMCKITWEIVRQDAALIYFHGLLARRNIQAPFPKDSTLRANFEPEHLLWCNGEVNAFFRAVLAQLPNILNDIDSRDALFRFVTPCTPADLQISGNKKLVKKLPWTVG